MYEEDYAGYEEEDKKKQHKKKPFKESVAGFFKGIGDMSYSIVHSVVVFKEEHPKEYEVYKWLAVSVVGGIAAKAVANHNKKVELANKLQEEALRQSRKAADEAERYCRHWDPRTMENVPSIRPLNGAETSEMDEAWRRGVSKAQYLASKGLLRY